MYLSYLPLARMFDQFVEEAVMSHGGSSVTGGGKRISLCIVSCTIHILNEDKHEDILYRM